MAHNRLLFVRKRGPAYKLTLEQAKLVKQAHEQGRPTVEEIAKQYGVTKQTIYNTLRRLQAEGDQ